VAVENGRFLVLKNMEKMEKVRSTKYEKIQSQNRSASQWRASIAGSCSFCKKNQKLSSFSRKRTKKGLDIY
jgi:hypothetical protein